MDLQALVNQFKFIAGVYAFDILPDGSYSEIRIIEERDPVWFRSMTNYGIRNMLLTAVRYDHALVGFIWATNFDTQRTLGIKETLELTTFMLAASIAHHHLVSRLEVMSRTDSLTQVLNRNAMNERVDKLIADPDSRPETLGVAFADLNGLKAVNNSGGHEAGDLLLQNAAALLKVVFGNYEIYRSGGDEFVIFCPGISRERLDESVARLRVLAENTPDVRYAIGTEWVGGSYDILAAMQAADKNMYQDKRDYYLCHPEKNRRRS